MIIADLLGANWIQSNSSLYADFVTSDLREPVLSTRWQNTNLYKFETPYNVHCVERKFILSKYDTVYPTAIFISVGFIENLSLWMWSASLSCRTQFIYQSR